MITAAQARALATKPEYERDIEEAASEGKTHVYATFDSHDEAAAAELVLKQKGFELGQIERIGIFGLASSFQICVMW